MGAWDFVLTPGNWITGLLRIPTHCPHSDETHDSLQGPQWFSLLDLKSGYWQVKMDEESKPLTTFTGGPLGSCKCERMPFGLAYMLTTFQQLMETCLGDLNLNLCIIYLDDIAILSKDQASHILRLEALFKMLEHTGLKLKPSKCKLFYQQITYLRHLGDSDWWKENGSHQEVSNPYHLHWNPELPWVHWVVALVYSQVCSDSPAFAWVDLWQECS